MRNTSFIITERLLISSVSAFSAESELSTITLRFIALGTFQIYLFNSQIFNNVLFNFYE